MTRGRPTIEATTWTQVAVAAMAGGGGAWLLLSTLQDRGLSLPVVGPVAWASVALIALGIGVLAARTHATVWKRREPMDPQQGLTRLLLGKTSLLGGAGLGGAYLALVALAWGGIPAPLASERVVHGGIAVLACLAWAGAGWALERACRIPPTDTGEPDTPPSPEVS